HVGAVREVTIPELAGHFLVLLVEALAVVRVDAAPHRAAVAELDLEPPIGVGERLPRGGDDVAGTLAQRALGEVERADAARRDDRRLESRGAQRAADRRGEREIAAERAARVAAHGRHALVAARARVGIGRLTALPLLLILELAALPH